jgi:hypothetical protein
MDMVEERYQYLRRMKKRYQKANRQERSRLLDEMEAYTDFNRQRARPLLRFLAFIPKSLYNAIKTNSEVAHDHRNHLLWLFGAPYPHHCPYGHKDCP